MASTSRAMTRAVAACTSTSSCTSSRLMALSAQRQFSTSTTLGPRSTTKSPYANRKVTDQPTTLSNEIKILPPTQYHARTHNHHVATLTLSAYTSVPVIKENIVFFTDFAIRAAYAMGIPVSGPAPTKLRKELWTVLKGPFAHKKAQENFERITSKRIVKVFDTNEELVDRWLHYLRIHSMVGVDMKAEVFKRRPVGHGKANFEAAKQVVAQSLQRVTADVQESNEAEQTPQDANSAQQQQQQQQQPVSS